MKRTEEQQAIRLLLCRGQVQTSHGTGSIIEVDGDKYLVDLDGQPGQL